MPLCPKYLGHETEYANTLIGPHGGCQGMDAAQDLLNAFYGQSCTASPANYLPRPGKDFLANGARVYQDHYHLEYSTPECRTPADLVAGAGAGDRLVEQARKQVAIERPDHQVVVLANNSDGQSHSYGGHINVQMDRKAFSQLFRQRPQLLYSLLIPYLVSIQVCTGAGKVGAENHTGAADYQLSARADFLQRADPAIQTTYDRPLINTRDEALGDSERFARLHCISFDTNRQEYALFLKAGSLQLMAAWLEYLVLEGSATLIDLTLAHPIRALRTISRDPTLKTTVRLENGRQYTALELQEVLLGGLQRFIDKVDLTPIVPDAQAIWAAWSDTLARLQAYDMDTLTQRLDWAAKYALVERYARASGWNHPSLKELDLMYHHTDPTQSLFHRCYVQTGWTRRVVDEARIAYLEHSPPEDTRAYLRGTCIRRFGDQLDGVDWHRLRFKTQHGWWPVFSYLPMDAPGSDTRAEVEGPLAQVHTLTDLLTVFADRIQTSTATIPTSTAYSPPGNTAHSWH